MIDATACHDLLIFMDGYLGYNQINMYPLDENKMTFTIDCVIYFYKVMLFGLKNAGATFQRMLNQIFKELIGNTMEVYFDDMLVKRLDHSDHVKHLGKVFSLL